MDIISHGLWGGVTVGRKNWKSFLLAFFFGIAPDLFSFGIFFVQRVFTEGFDVSHSGPPEITTIPLYVHTMYDITHSLVVFSIVFIVVWLFFERPVYEMFAWLFHILLDIPTHSSEFFPTPFLWPLSDVTIDGRNWSNPEIFVPNLILLALAYIWFYRSKRTNDPD